MTEPDSTEMEIYSGADDRPEFLIRFPVDVTAEQVAEFEEHYLASRARRRPSRVAPIDTSWVTTEPVYEGPKWMHVVKLIASFVLLCMFAAICVAVVVKA